MSSLLMAGILIFVFAVLNFYCSVQILRRVSEQDAKMNFFELRWQVHKKMQLYCRLTRNDDGHIGFAFYGYWISLIVMLMAIFWLFSSISTGDLAIS